MMMRGSAHVRDVDQLDNTHHRHRPHPSGSNERCKRLCAERRNSASYATARACEKSLCLSLRALRGELVSTVEHLIADGHSSSGHQARRVSQWQEVLTAGRSIADEHSLQYASPTAIAHSRDGPALYRRCVGSDDSADSGRRIPRVALPRTRECHARAASARARYADVSGRCGEAFQSGHGMRGKDETCRGPRGVRGRQG